MTLETALCPSCGNDEAAPVLCQRCTRQLTSDADIILGWRVSVATWEQIDPGTPGRDEQHRLALMDSPLLTRSGGANLRLIAITDSRSRSVIDDDGKHHPDDVPTIDAELLALARMITEERRLSTGPGDALGVAKLVRVHADWLARHHAADEHAAILADLARAVRDHGDPILGRCNAIRRDEAGDYECGGPLREDRQGPLPIEVASHRTPTHLTCGWCGETWPADAATLLGMLAVVDTRPLPMPLEWCADALLVGHWTLRSWVRRGHVRRYGDGQVDLRDVVRRVRDTPTTEPA